MRFVTRMANPRERSRRRARAPRRLPRRFSRPLRLISGPSSSTSQQYGGPEIGGTDSFAFPTALAHRPPRPQPGLRLPRERRGVQKSFADAARASRLPSARPRVHPSVAARPAPRRPRGAHVGIRSTHVLLANGAGRVARTRPPRQHAYARAIEVGPDAVAAHLQLAGFVLALVPHLRAVVDVVAHVVVPQVGQCALASDPLDLRRTPSTEGRGGVVGVPEEVGRERPRRDVDDSDSRELTSILCWWKEPKPLGATPPSSFARREEDLSLRPVTHRRSDPPLTQPPSPTSSSSGRGAPFSFRTLLGACPPGTDRTRARCSRSGRRRAPASYLRHSRTPPRRTRTGAWSP